MFLGSDLHRHRGTIQVHERAPWRSDGAILGLSPLVVLQSASSPPNPHAMSSARRTSSHRVSNKLHKTGPIRSGWASDTWSKFSAHAAGIPSSAVKTTSVVNPRICSRRRYDDDLIQTVDDGVSSENQHRPPLIGKPKSVPDRKSTRLN